MEGHVQSQASPFTGHPTLFTLAENFCRYLYLFTINLKLLSYMKS